LEQGDSGIYLYRAREPEGEESNVELPFAIPADPLSRTTGILLIILGIIALVFPVPVFHLIEWFFALLVLFMAIGLVRKGLSKDAGARGERILLLLCGIAGLAAGLAILLLPRIITIASKDIIAIWALVTGAGLILSVFTSETGFERSISAVTGLVLVLVGILMVAVPVIVTDYLLVIILGFFAIGTGILAIILGPSPPAQKPEIDARIYK